MIDSQVLAGVIDCALSGGASFAEVFVEDTRRFSLQFVDSIAKEMTRGRDHGAGIRVFYGKRSVYAHTSDLRRDNLLSIACGVAAVGDGEKPTSAQPLSKLSKPVTTKVALPSSSAPVEEFIDFARCADQAARGVDPAIAQVTCGISWSEQDILIANSTGVHAAESRSYTMAGISVVAAEKGQQQTGSERRPSRTGLDAFRAVDPQATAISAAESALLILRAPYSPAGNMPVIIGNSFGGVIFHEATGHALETTSVAKNSSTFADKLGQQVATPGLTAIDDGTIAGRWGTTAIDDEGAPTQKTVLIENGILKSFMVDQLGGIKTGYVPTGSGRRQNYRFAPTSRMRNTYIAAGTDSIDEMISSVKQGIYARKMGGGSVNPATGEFNFAVLEGFLIKDGKLAGPVRGASLIGFGHEIIQRIEMIGSDLELESGTCGSVSGWVPTTVGQPTLKVSEITVGGRT
jgi:TldD protein